MKKLMLAAAAGALSLAAIVAGCAGLGGGPQSPAGGGASPGFAQAPAVEREGAGFRIRFAAAAPTDCAVWIAGADGKAVRHLAAGRLGGAAPAPLAPGRLEQSLLWDGADDAGRPVAAAEKCTVRVGLGLAPRFDRAIGFNPQSFGHVYALAVGRKGEVYVYSNRGICVLDRQGKYQRQIVPAPAGLPDAKLAGLEPVRLADGTACYRRPYALPGEMIGSMAIAADGSELFLPGPGRYPRKLTRIGTDGSVRAGAFDQQLTALSDVGFLSLAAAPDGRTLYFAGAEAGYQGDDARKVCYRQVVYRLRLDAPGPAEIFTGDDENEGAPGFSVSRPKGLATDAAGRLYVCNNERDRGDKKFGDIAVYTPDGGMVKTIPVDYPQQVAVHPRTGQLYVLAGREQGFTKYGYDYPASMREARLVRLAADGKEELSVKLEDPFVKTRKEGTWPEFRLCMAADFSAERPVVWVGVASPPTRWSKWALFRIEDQGDQFGAPVEVSPKPGPDDLPNAAGHFALDRARDILYLNDDSTQLLRFTGEGKALPPLRFTYEETDEKTGEKKTRRHHLAEAAVGPDGNLYVLAYHEYKYSDDYVLRFDPEGRALPFAAGEVKASHVMKGPGGHSSRGFSVGPDGSLYVLYYDDRRPAELLPPEPWDRGFLMTAAVAKYDRDGRLLDPRLVAHLRSGAQGVRADRAGCIYVTDNVTPVGTSYPADFAGLDPLKRAYPARLADGSFDPLLRMMGSVFKFGPAGGQMVGLPADDRTAPYPRPAGDLWKPAPEVQWFPFNNHRVRLSGALWQFHGTSPVPAQYQGVTHVERCVCRGLRFDLDEFDRVYVPDVIRHRVTVLDSAGNLLCRIGKYGNQDSVGPEIGLAAPANLAAAADRLYIADGAAGRVLRVKLGYAVEASCPLAGAAPLHPF